MASDDEDDYLSDKFLAAAAAPAPQRPKTYAERRREAERISALKSEQNRSKSRRQLELESREEGLSKSLFERAQEEEAALSGTKNKALSMMMKMGFKPGQALGKVDDDDDEPQAQVEAQLTSTDATSASSSTPAVQTDGVESGEDASKPKLRHMINPLPINEWNGKTGIGVRKRPPSPSSMQRVAKMAKLAEAASKEDFRDRSRRVYQERQAEGKLHHAQRTCVTLDEKSGIDFNVLWLNPNDHDSFPDGLLDALSDASYDVLLGPDTAYQTKQARLKQQMRLDALQPVEDLDETPQDPKAGATSQLKQYSEEQLEESAQFLRLGPRDRLSLVVSYMRDKHTYCFWCGAQYENYEEMLEQCPGTEEDDHD